MKKILHALFFLMLLSCSAPLFAQRYLTEIFSSVSVTSNVVYGNNNSVIRTPEDPVGFHPTAGLTLYHDTLVADVYEPVGDALAARPTVIMIHTGSFLPIFYNGQPTGAKTDSTLVEMCRRFARRGFTAISMDYRFGWDPVALTQQIRKGTLLQAAGRGIQDAKACIRYFRNNALNANTYHIDETNIILGGMGTGGYIALGVATLEGNADISIPKFLASPPNDPAHGFTAGVTFFDSTLWGNTDGYGGSLNVSSNTPGVSNAVSFVFNCGGALADSSWLRSGDVPMVCFHVVNDPFAPYADGTVIVPTTGDPVVDVSGSYTIVRRADSLMNNLSFQNNNWTDPYTVRANQVNQGHDGLFPFYLPSPGPPLFGQAGPWEWYDSSTVYFICRNVLGFTAGKTDSLWYGSFATNPDMSRNKGMAYIDTIMGYTIPRIFPQLVGVNDMARLEKSVSVYPNPARNYFYIRSSNGSAPMKHVGIHDITGRLIKSFDKINGETLMVDTRSFDAGMYLLKISFDTGEVIKKITLQ